MTFALGFFAPVYSKSSIDFKSWMTGEFDRVVASGKSPSYAEGFVSGCSSRKHDDGELDFENMQDEARLAKDGEFSSGFDQGYSDCKGQTQKRWFKRLRQASDKYNPRDESRRKIWEELRK